MMRRKTLIAILICVLLFTAASAQGGSINLEGGPGFYKSLDSLSVFLNYHLDSSPFFGFRSFYGMSFGYWNGDNSNNAIILAKGILFNLSGDSYFCFEPGGAYVTQTTSNLGTPLQFSFRFALGARREDMDISLGYRHFSNGKGVFRWTEKANYGENFITVQAGYSF